MAGIHCCKDCAERWIDSEKGTRCHSTCERYLKERAKLDKENEARQQRILKEDLVYRKQRQIRVEKILRQHCG